MWLLRRPHGFTLIEMMVVVAVVALLIALLLPVLGSSKESARLIHCQANLKQLGLAWLTYPVDHKDGLAVSENNVASKSWVYWATGGVSESIDDLQAGSIWPYTQTAEVYRCPSEDRVASDGRPYIRSYSITSYLNGNYNGVSLGQTKAPTVNAIPRPSQTMLMLDEADPRNRVRGSFQAYARGLPGRQWQWIDWPAAFHFNGFPHAQADGSVVFRQYEDGRTAEINGFYESHPGSVDWAYVADHFDPGEPNNP